MTPAPELELLDPAFLGLQAQRLQAARHEVGATTAALSAEIRSLTGVRETGGAEERLDRVDTVSLDLDRAREQLAQAAIRLVDVDAALARLDTHTYGRCTDCGGPIGRARLDAIPETPTCVTCHARPGARTVAIVRAAPEPETGVDAAGGRAAVAVLTRGLVDEEETAYAVRRVGAVLEHIGDPVLFARLKLARAGDPARSRPALAQVSLDVDGELVRAHVAAGTMQEAADLLERHLRDKLQHRAERRDALRSRTGQAEPGEWRHGDLPTDRPEYYDRPLDERQLVRHKTFAIDERTVDEAAFDMDQFDYDFHLFRDLATGEDAVLERRPGGGYRLTRLHPHAGDGGPTALALTIADTTPPQLTVTDALQRLDAVGEPFVFFADATTGRGNVVYRRYDGHYGLITPA